mmetsp:Transcript_118921/g.337166  ORF Transcript_118921/g.337166 Transcript_118921/m.337166 type:complete len:242 (+) Transcript_118921:1003-1728(+)
MADLRFSSTTIAQRSGPDPSISKVTSSTSLISADSLPAATFWGCPLTPNFNICFPTLKSMSRPFAAASIYSRTVMLSEFCTHLYPTPCPLSATFRPLGTAGSTRLGATSPKRAWCDGALLLRAATTSSVSRSSSAVARSVLFTTTTSAHSTCSARSWPTFSSRALFFSSCLSPCTSSFRSCACRVSSQSRPKVLASTTVTTCFTSVRSATGMVHSRPMVQFLLTASGSPTPLSSTTMCSNM